MELRTFLGVLCRRRWVFGIAYLLFVGAVVVWSVRAAKLWEGTAKVMMVEASTALSTFTQTLGVATSGSPVGVSTTSKNYDTEIALATLGQSLDRIITDLQLTGKNGKPLTRKKLAPTSSLSKLASKLSARPYIEVSELENSDILQITSYSTSSAQAAEMSNKLAQLFVQNRVDTVRSEFQAVRAQLRQNLQKVEWRYRELALAKRDMQQDDNIVDIASEQKSLLEYIATVEKKLDDIQISIASKIADVTPNHPDVVALKNQADIVRDILKSKTQADRSSYPTKSMKQTEMDLILTVYSNIYGQLTTYAAKLDIAESMTVSKISVLEPAVAQTEYAFPNKPLALILALALGFCWALGLALAVDSLDNTVKNQDDLEAYPYPFLGKVSAQNGEELLPDTESGQGSDYGQIIWNLREGRPADATLRKLVIAGIAPRSGASTVAVHIGGLLAQDGLRVLVVDANTLSPSLHRRSAGDGAKGLTDMLHGKVKFSEVIRQTDVSGLDLLPLGATSSNPGILFASGKMRGVMEELGRLYDAIIFDGTPLLIRNDAVILARQSDALLLVAKSGMTTKPALTRVGLLLNQSSIKPAGIVLTGVGRDEYRDVLPLFSKLTLFHKPQA